MQNWTNDFNVFILAMAVLLIGLQCEFIRNAGNNFSEWVDEKADDVSGVFDDFGFTEQDFNK